MMRIYIYYTCDMATGYPGPKDEFNPEEVSVLGRILYKFPREKVARPGARPGANIVLYKSSDTRVVLSDRQLCSR
jgi:hypothetical protein